MCSSTGGKGNTFKHCSPGDVTLEGGPPGAQWPADTGHLSGLEGLGTRILELHTQRFWCGQYMCPPECACISRREPQHTLPSFLVQGCSEQVIRRGTSEVDVCGPTVLGAECMASVTCVDLRAFCDWQKSWEPQLHGRWDCLTKTKKIYFFYSGRCVS